MLASPKKSLGQHFLTQPSFAEKIVRLAQVVSTDSILEIGPGRGILTEALAKTGASVVAIEKDRELVPLLREKFDSFKNVRIVEGDVLAILNDDTGPPVSSPCKVVANLPYNIATEIIFRLLEQREFFSDLYLMVQREVANRLVAKPGGRDYGVLSLLTQLFSETKIILKVPPTAFFPKPRVDSAIVHFHLSVKPRWGVTDLPLFKRLVRAAFGSRRKTVWNSLKGHLQGFDEVQISSGLEQAGIRPTDRAEQIPPEKWVALAKAL